MSDLIHSKTLLNDNQTDFEFAFEQSLKKLAENEDIYEWLTDPQKTDAALLDIMAEEAGVVDWFGSDLESAKRDSIEQATFIHQKSGTREGLKQALSALGFIATVEKGAKPYSLLIEGYIKDKPFSVDISKRVNARVNSYKSERDSVDIVLSIGRVSNKYHGALLQQSKIKRVQAAELVPPSFNTTKQLAKVVYSVKTVRINHG